MKKINVLLATMLLFTGALSAQDSLPDANELANTYIEMIGGEEAWLAIKAIKMKGSAAMQGMEFPLTITTAEGNKMRQDVEIQGSPMVQAYDGETAWMLFPLQGIKEPKEMSADEAADMIETPFLTEFINSEERGYQLESVAGKELEGTATHAIRVTNDSGYDRTYYFDKENSVPIMVESTVKSGPTKGVTMETYLSDYQQFGDVVIPMYMENKMNGQSFMKITLTEAEINPELDAAIFSMPK